MRLSINANDRCDRSLFSTFFIKNEKKQEKEQKMMIVELARRIPRQINW